MSTLLSPGDRCGALIFKGYRLADKTIIDNGVTEQFTVRMMDFTCSCSIDPSGTCKEECRPIYSIPTSQFKGKKQTRDCGCGKGRAERKSILSVYVPTALLETVDEWAQRQFDGNRSETVTYILQKYFGDYK